MWRRSRSPSPGPRSQPPGSPGGASWQSPRWLELLLRLHLMSGWLNTSIGLDTCNILFQRLMMLHYKTTITCISSKNLQSYDALTNTVAEWGSQTPSWTLSPAPDCTHPGTASTCAGSHTFTQQMYATIFGDKRALKQQTETYGLLVECLWFFQAILAKCSGFVPEKKPN